MDGTGIYAQRFAADGSHVGNEFLVNATTNGQQQYPAIAAGPNGQFTIAWQGNNQDGSGFGIFAQRYNANGTAAGNEFQVNSYTTDDQVYPSVAYNDHGGFAITWNGKGAGDANGVFVREFGADGAALGSESLVNSTTDGAQQFSTVVAASSGYVVAWSGKGTGDSDGVFLRRLGSGPTTSGIDDVSVWRGRVSSTIDLWPAFEDEENADSALTYEVTADSNPDLFSSVEIDPATGQLALGYAIGAMGSAELTVRTTDPGGLSVETTFNATIAEPDSDPYLWYFPHLSHVWNTTTANWNDRSDGAGYWYAWPNNSFYSAAFGGTAPDTVTIAAGGVTANNVTFDRDGYTIQGGTLTLTGSGPSGINISGMNHSGTINANISVTSDGQIWTTGTGTTLYIGGTVTFTNETLYIEGYGTGGEIIFSGSGTHSGGSLRIRNSGTATFTGGSLHVGSMYVGFVGTGVLNWNSSGTLNADYWPAPQNVIHVL